MHSMLFNVMTNMGFGPRLRHHRLYYHADLTCGIVWGPFMAMPICWLKKCVPWSLDPSKHETWWTTNYFFTNHSQRHCHKLIVYPIYIHPFPQWSNTDLDLPVFWGLDGLCPSSRFPPRRHWSPGTPATWKRWENDGKVTKTFSMHISWIASLSIYHRWSIILSIWISLASWWLGLGTGAGTSLQDANWCADSLVQGTSGGVLFGDLGGSESSQEVFGSIPFEFKSLTTGPQSKLKRVENLELKWLNGEAQLGPWSFVPKKLQPILLLVNSYSIPHPV